MVAADGCLADVGTGKVGIASTSPATRTALAGLTLLEMRSTSPGPPKFCFLRRLHDRNAYMRIYEITNLTLIDRQKDFFTALIDEGHVCGGSAIEIFSICFRLGTCITCARSFLVRDVS